MDRSKEIVRVSIVGILVNLFLVAVKAVIGFLARSTSVLLDAVNNFSDALSSLITIIGTKLAHKPADKDHPYGYGRIEYLSSMIIAVIVLFAGFTAFKESAEKILAPADLLFSYASAIAVGAAVLVKIFLGLYFRKKGTALHSGALSASGSDALFDAVLSASTLVSILVFLRWGINAEGWIGVVISVFILKSGFEILRDTLNDIIGIRTDSEFSKEIRETAESVKGVKGAYDLVLHDYGPEEKMGSIHVEVEDHTTAKEIDTISRTIIREVYRKYGVILTVGIYASNTPDAMSETIRTAVQKELAAYPSVLQMHGFYADTEKKAVSFDIVMDFAEKHQTELAEKIRTSLTEQFPEYHFMIVLDKDFTN